MQLHICGLRQEAHPGMTGDGLLRGACRRARNLHACAVTVLRDHGGIFPDTEEGLRALPGIGPYTAAAIASIAFGRHVMPVDGNIERVVSRLYAVEEPLTQAKPLIRQLGPARRTGCDGWRLRPLAMRRCRT